MGDVEDEVAGEGGEAFGGEPEDLAHAAEVDPADLLEPEVEQIRAEFGGIAKSDEDVLLCALFPKVAPGFLEKKYGKKEEKREDPVRTIRVYY